MHVAAVQLDIAWEDKPANHARIEAMLDDAALPAGTFVVLPELGDTGFSFDLDRIVDGTSLPWAQHLAQKRGLWLQAGYAVRGSDGRGRNCAAIINPHGEAVGVYQKIQPFSFGQEGRYYSGGEHLVVHPCPDAAVCPLICYDLRFPELWRHGALGGAEVFTIGASWPNARQAHWRTLLLARAIENQAYVIGVNRTGSDPHLNYAGGSIIIAPGGAVLAEAGEEEAVIRADLDLAAMRAWRDDFPALRDARREFLGHLTIESNLPPGA